MGTHTSGPWTVCEDGERNIQGSISIGVASPCGWFVADVWADADELKASAQANARLIAAAPDLLAALRDVYENVRSDSPDMWCRVVDAINKATKP